MHPSPIRSATAKIAANTMIFAVGNDLIAFLDYLSDKSDSSEKSDSSDIFCLWASQNKPNACFY